MCHILSKLATQYQVNHIATAWSIVNFSRTRRRAAYHYIKKKKRVKNPCNMHPHPLKKALQSHHFLDRQRLRPHNTPKPSYMFGVLLFVAVFYYFLTCKAVCRTLQKAGTFCFHYLKKVICSVLFVVILYDSQYKLEP
jgi:hypothetical protein